MKNIVCRNWIAKNPFEKAKIQIPTNPLLSLEQQSNGIALLILKQVSLSKKTSNGNKGLIYTKGIGEVPVVQMATFSQKIERSKELEESKEQGSNEKTENVMV